MDEQVEAKLLSLARDVLTPAQARATLGLLWHLEDLDDMTRILDHLQISSVPTLSSESYISANSDLGN
jgi:hypothetical protein